MANISSLLAKAQKDFEDKKQSLQAHYERELKVLLSEAKSEVAKGLQVALDAYLAIPEDRRGDVLGDSVVKGLLNKFGVKKNKAAGGKVSEASLEAVRGVLYKDAETPQGEVEKKSKLSALTAGKALRQLYEQREAHFRKDGTTNYWKLL